MRRSGPPSSITLLFYGLAQLVGFLSIGTSAFSQTAPSLRLAKQIDYIQTGATTLEIRQTHLLYSFVFAGSSLQIPSFGSAQIRLVVNGVTHTATSNPSTPILRTYNTIADLERNFPTSALATYQAVSTSWTSSGSLDVPATTPMPVAPVTNFDALQNWDGGPLQVRLVLPALQPSSDPGELDSSPPISSGIWNLYLHRTANPLFGSEAPLIVAQSVSDSGVTLTGIEAQPGETIYAELRRSRPSDSAPSAFLSAVHRGLMLR